MPIKKRRVFGGEPPSEVEQPLPTQVLPDPVPERRPVPVNVHDIERLKMRDEGFDSSVLTPALCKSHNVLPNELRTVESYCWWLAERGCIFTLAVNAQGQLLVWSDLAKRWKAGNV